MGRPRNQPKQTNIKLSVIIWANIVKWQTIRGISDAELSLLLGVKSLADRKRTHFITGDNIEDICRVLQIEPEKLLER